ncbi:hypothetical protein Ciccas_009649 [Cichlidogyrus casuarinus]|uniref:Uncharacterized protein n=1 Tax=Cichlidogyrus casuarinus TaxID=1844966 RepID=A0ABD2Q0X6_9PLAT
MKCFNRAPLDVDKPVIQELRFSKECTVFVNIVKYGSIIQKFSYDAFNEEVKSLIKKLKSELVWENVEQFVVDLIAMLNHEDMPMSTRLSDVKTYLEDISNYLTEEVEGSMGIIADFDHFSEEINKCYLDGQRMIAYNYFLSKSAICHQEWFTEKASGTHRQTKTFLVQMLLIKLVVKMVELDSVNMGTNSLTCQQEKVYSDFSRDELFTICSVSGLFAFKLDWDDKAWSVAFETYPKDTMIKQLSKYRDERSRLAQGKQLNFNTFLKILLIALVSNKLSRAEKVAQLDETCVILTGKRESLKKKYPNEWAKASADFDQLLQQMEAAWNETQGLGGVKKAADLFMNKSVDLSQAWKIIEDELGIMNQLLCMGPLTELLAQIDKATEPPANWLIYSYKDDDV